MYEDGFQTTVPVANEVQTTQEIGTIFNSITYSKGASLLKMLEATVGEENFRQGLNVNKKKFHNK
jgi:aminopeptidase N